MYIIAKSKVPSSVRIYLAAMSSMCFRTSRAKARRAESAAFSSPTIVAARLKFSSGNLASIGMIPAESRITASAVSPFLKRYWTSKFFCGRTCPSRSCNSCSPTDPRNLGAWSACCKAAMSLPTSKMRREASSRRPSCWRTSLISLAALSRR